MCIAGDRKRSDASSVEGMVHGNYLMSGMTISCESIFLCCFDSSLYGLCTAVGKENTIHFACLKYLVCRLDDRRIVVEV